MTIPASNFPRESQKFGRWIVDSITALQSQMATRKQRETNANQGLNGTVGNLQSQVNTLNAIQQTYYDYNNLTYANPGAAGWVTSTRPNLTINTPTGSIKVGFGAAANGGNGIVALSIVDANGNTFLDKTTFVGNPAQGIYLSGGASFTPTGWRSLKLGGFVPNANYTVSVEMYMTDAYCYFFGPNLLIEVTP